MYTSVFLCLYELIHMCMLMVLIVFMCAFVCVCECVCVTRSEVRKLNIQDIKTEHEKTNKGAKCIMQRQ